MTILSKKQPGSTNNPAQATNDTSSTNTTASSITLQPINEPIPTTESEESNLMNETTNSGIKSPVQSITPVKQDSGDVTSSPQTVSPNKVKSKKSNKRKIKSSNIAIANNFVSQTNMASMLSSSSSSSSGSYSFSYQNDQTEYYRLSDDSDYELNDEDSLFFSMKNERKKNDSKSKKISKPSSNLLSTTNKIVKAKRNKNSNEIKFNDNSENNNSEDEYDQTSSILVNSSQDETFIKTAKTLEELEQNFCRALKEKKGFIIKPMKEDGACLFRAVADQIYGDQEMHSTIRCHCMDYIAKNGDYFKQYMTEDIERYLVRKRQDNCFGNHIEIIAIAEIYNRPIEVYEYSIEPKNTFQSEFQTDNEPIRLSYHGRMHYNSVVNPFKATIGVGLGLPQLMPGLAEKNLLNEALKKSEEFQIEQAMLDDKTKATDWEATNEELMDLVARESYLQWLKDNEKRENVNFLQATTAASCSSWSSNEFALSSKEKTKCPPSSKSSPSSSKTSSKISSATSQSKEIEDIDLFALTNQTVNHNSLQDDDDILARVLAESQQEYLDSLKIKHHQQHQHSHQI